MTKLLTPTELSSMLQVSLATISRMAAHGDLPVITLKAGRRKKLLRFDSAQIERWLNARTHAGRERKSHKTGNEVATPKPEAAQLSESISGNGVIHRSVRTEGD